MRQQKEWAERTRKESRRGWMIGLVILAAAVLLVAFWVKRNLYASKFRPVHLVASEQAALDRKLSQLEEGRVAPGPKGPEAGSALPPEPYSETGASREIILTERELNSLVAGDTEIAERVAIDLSNDLISVKVVVPVDKDLPLLGGKTMRFHMGLIVRYRQERPYIALKGISLGGIPLPNAWMGSLKHVNLLEEFGSEDGFWKMFEAGVRTIEVRRGRLRIRLKE